MSRRRHLRRKAVALAAASLAVAGPAAVADDDGLGRLFFTPEQRQQLDRQRLHAARTDAAQPRIVVDGEVRRSSGRHTAWINGEAQRAGEVKGGVVVRPDPRQPGRLVIGTDEMPAAGTAHVGETVDRDTLATGSPLGTGRIVVHRRAPGDAPATTASRP